MTGLHVQSVDLFVHGSELCKLWGGYASFSSGMMKKTTDCAESFYYIVVIVKTPEIIQKKTRLRYFTKSNNLHKV